MSVDWAVPTGKCVDASPLVAQLEGGSCAGAVATVVFIGSHSGLFFAIGAWDGQVIWKTQTGGRIESSACLSRCAKFVIFGKICSFFVVFAVVCFLTVFSLICFSQSTLRYLPVRVCLML